MKRNIYIVCFAVLGFLTGFLLHMVIEISVIKALVLDWDKYGLGLSYDQWVWVHDIFVAFLVTSGAYVGFRMGRHWWQVLYVQKKYGKPWI